MVDVSNGFEQGVSGNALTAAGSGGGADTALDTVTTAGVGSTATYDNAHVKRGALAGKFVVAGAAASTSYAGWATTVGTQTTVYLRAYFYVGVNPTGAATAIMRVLNGGNLCVAVNVATNGLLTLRDANNAVIATSASALPLNQWVRLELKVVCSATVGTAELRIYSADSTAPIETISGTNLNTNTQATGYRLGASTAGAAVTMTAWMDDVGVSTTNWLGPTVNATVNAVAATGSGDMVVPSVRTGAVLTAPLATATAAFPVPSVSAGASVQPPASTATADALAPTFTLSAVVNAPTATGTADLLVPSVTADAGGANVAAPTATGTGAALAPTVDVRVDVGAASQRVAAGSAAAEARTPPANDNLVDRTTLSGPSGAVTYSTVAATLETAEDPLDSRVFGPAGSVWFDWNQAGFAGLVAFASALTSDRVEAYVYRPDIPDFPQGWFDNTTDYATWGDSIYQNSLMKLFRVVTVADIPAGATWSPMAQASDQRTDGTGFHLEVDMYVGNPGDPSHEGYGHYVGLQEWDHSDLFNVRTGLAPDGTPDVLVSGAVPAGTIIWLLAIQQQWDFRLWSLPIVDPAVNWDPKLDMGTWDLSGVPFVPWNLTDMVQVELPVPIDQWTFDFSAVANLYAGLTPIGGGDGSVIAEPRAGESVAVRVYPLDGSQPSDGAEFSWQAIARSVEMTILQPTVTTPGVLQVAVTNEPAGETLSFTVDADPTVLETAVTDDDGAVTVVIATDNLIEGDHLVYVASDTGRDGSAAFTVANDTTYYPPDPTVAPVDPIAPVVVNKWQFYDPTDMTVWTFPINPDKHDSLLAPRTFSFDHTSSPLGQHLVFEAMSKPKQWKCSGSLLTLADVEALSAWRKPYLVYLTDDFGRNLRVRVLNVQTKPVRSVDYPELHTYTITCILYGRN